MEPEESSWDPEPPSEHIEMTHCRALLLELIRRTAHDWVLYRQHERMALKQLAQEAFVWLFEEEPGHPWWEVRKEEGRFLTGFLTICDELDLDPEVVRSRVRQLDVKTILSAGRPPEKRKAPSEESHYGEYVIAVDMDVQAYGDNPSRSFYENHYAVGT